MSFGTHRGRVVGIEMLDMNLFNIDKVVSVLQNWQHGSLDMLLWQCSLEIHVYMCIKVEYLFQKYLTQNAYRCTKNLLSIQIPVSLLVLQL